MKNFLIIALASTWLISSSAFASSAGLKAQVRFELPSHITTVAQAADWFLEPHGYRLALGGNAPREASAIALQSLPAALPNGRVMTIEDALLAITLDDQAVVIDNEHKLVSFELFLGGAQ
ncbi:MAG: hypothetical protein AAF465_13540 [Pseudomonadota bacterium]